MSKPTIGSTTNTTKVRTGRYYVRVHEEMAVEIGGYIQESGMYQAHFLSNALVVGARQLALRRRKAPT